VTVFVEEIVAADLTIADVAKWDTPSAHALPNGQAATRANDTTATATNAESGGEFAIPFGVDDFTVELWVYYTATGDGSNYWFAQRSGSVATVRAWELRQPGEVSRKVRFAILGTDGATVLANHEVLCDLDAWTYCAFTFLSSLGAAPVAGRDLIAYKNGGAVSTVTVGSGVNLTGPTLTDPVMALGANTASQPAITIAEMAKLAIYHRALSPAEILDHYEAMTT
jgi:Concanavalin A-like lectin/glucanases superfamily